MHSDSSNKAVDMSPEAISRRIRKAFDLGMLNRHLLSKLVKVSPESASSPRVEDEQPKIMSKKIEPSNAPH
jgi:hypothetical protein